MTGFRTAVQGQILEVVLDNPKANAIDSRTSRALTEVFTGFNADPDLRVAIITGAGERFFSAGADLKEIDATGGAVDYGPNGFAGLIEFPDLRKPVIAAVNGLCVGGGFELALACDMIVASETAQFFLTEARIGNLPYLASVQRLMARLPVNIATEMLYTGRRMSAADLKLLGLVNHVVSPGDLRDAAGRRRGCLGPAVHRRVPARHHDDPGPCRRRARQSGHA